jgi:WhiB family redox-sensing transcriptional regulator
VSSIDNSDNKTSSSNSSAWGLSTDPDAEEWMAAGLCAQTDPDAFFPEKGGSTREAKAVCRRCPVIDECLTYAIEHDERFGIWGGYSERERRRIKRGERVHAAHGPDCTCPHCRNPQIRKTA